jgi:hypothetical protein
MADLMSRHISDEQLEIIHTAVTGLTRKVQEPVPGFGIMPWGEHRNIIGVDLRDVACALDELKQRRRRNGKFGGTRIGPVTSTLIRMKIGESVLLRPMTSGALTTARKTARKHMDDPSAVWHSVTLPSGMRKVTRMPPGTPVHADYSNPAVYVLAGLKVGDMAVLTTLKGKMHAEIKTHARQVMNLPEANWKCENLANGTVRCRRTK